MTLNEFYVWNWKLCATNWDSSAQETIPPYKKVTIDGNTVRWNKISYAVFWFIPEVDEEQEYIVHFDDYGALLLNGNKEVVFEV